MRFCLAILPILTLPLAAGAETRITSHCLGNATESCFDLIEGPIERGLTERFKKVYETGGGEGAHVFLNSPGGNLGEALRLGRYLREEGYKTSIGGSDGIPIDTDGNPDFWKDGKFPEGGRCESACAYVFMGGENRRMTEGSRLGLHRFHAPGQEIGGEKAQELSGQLISYIVEMGIDARVFVLASGEDAGSMYHVSQEEAEEYDLVTPFGYEAFFMEPYGQGVIASAKRANAVGAYDQVQQVTAYCSQGDPHLLFFAGFHGLQKGDREAFRIRLDGQDFSVPAQSVNTNVNASGAYIAVRLPSDLAQRVTSAQSILTGFAFPRVVGGSYGASLSLSDMDRQMISAAFRFCIG